MFEQQTIVEIHQDPVNIPPKGGLEEIERRALIDALKVANGVQKHAAKLLGIPPRVMNYKMKKLGIPRLRDR